MTKSAESSIDPKLIQGVEIITLQLGNLQHDESVLIISDNETAVIGNYFEKILNAKDLKVVTIKKPTIKNLEDALFTWKVLRHAKSNGILIAKDGTTVGLGAGQVSRVDAVQTALKKGGELVNGCVLASDAFFPFRDSIDTIKDSGISMVIQPGGSIRDQEVIEACNEYGISMVFTGTRCFKH